MSLANKIRGIKEIWKFDNRWYLLLTRLFFPAEAVNVYKFKNLKILTDHSAGDANGAREILTSDMYRRYLADLNVPEKINVLDLGANNGGFALLLKSEKLDLKKVVCVELNPNTFSRLEYNLYNNFGSRAVALNAAVCGSSRELKIKLGTGGASDNIYNVGSAGGDNADYKISGKSFDEIYAENYAGEIIDVCKLDVEGAEFEILGGEHCRSIKNCRYLIMEIHHEKERRREFALKKLARLNFEELHAAGKTDENHHVHFFVNRELNPRK